MLQTVDSAPADEATSRTHWMALLARAPLALLETEMTAYLATCGEVSVQWLRPPETGLMMVQARAGGTGERFNLGEVTVTRCTLRLSGAAAPAPAGVAYVLGRSKRHARLAAMADALLQDPARHHGLQAGLLEPIRRHLQSQQSARHARAQSTRVEFFTIARESGGGEDEEGGA